MVKEAAGSLKLKARSHKRQAPHGFASSLQRSCASARVRVRGILSAFQRWSLFGQAVAELQFEAVLFGQRADAEPATSITQAHAATVAQRFEYLDAG